MVVACTAHGEEEYAQKAWIHGMDEVIEKPIDSVIVKNILMEVIEQ